MKKLIIGQTQDLPLQKNVEMFGQNISSKKAFTLVELIIVITILTILGTISFISFQDYFADARDANRVTTIANIKQSLDLQKMKTRKYPTPAQAVSYTGGNTEIQQGVINKEIFSDMSNDPKDPGSGEYYTYSISENGKYYQIAAQLENEVGYKSFVSKTYADDYESVKVEGNYRFDPSFPSLIIVPSSYTSGSGIFAPSVCFVLDGGENTLTTCNETKSEMSLKEYDKSLLGYWSFDESGFIPSSNPYSGTGFYKDYSGNEHHAFNSGTIQGASFIPPTQTGGYIGKGLYFTSVSLILGSDSNFNLKNNFTLSVIIKESSFKNIFPRIFDSRKFLNYMNYCSFNPIESICPELILKGGGDYNIQFGVYGSGTSMEDRTIKKNSYLKLGEYIKLDFTFSDNITNTYINGILYNKFQDNSFKNTNFLTGTLSQESIRIGGQISSRARDFHGIIDDVKIYNRTLSDDEILQQSKIAGF